MEREELWEWLGLIAAILVWWPALFGWFPVAYEVFATLFSGAVVVIVGLRRVGRIREGLRYSREIMEYQRRNQPPEPLEKSRPRKN